MASFEWPPQGGGGGSGTVTSVALTAPSSILSVSGSPVTSAGTLALSLVTQSANTLWAGPTSGAAATPTFRSLVGADFGTQTANTVLAGPTTGSAANPTFRSLVTADLPVGTGTVTSVTFTGDGTVLSSTPSSAVTSSGTLTATLNTQSANLVLAGPTTGSAADPTFRALTTADLPAGIGTVTSVALSAPSSILSVSGSPITNSGTLALSLVSQTANTVWAGPTTGTAANPTFRALVTADLPAGTGTVSSVTFTGDGTVLSSTPSSPVTSTGTLTASLNIQSANTVLAGPTTGSPADPTFRNIVGADFNTQSANTVLAGPTSGSAANPTFRTLVASDLPAPVPPTLQSFYPSQTFSVGTFNVTQGAVYSDAANNLFVVLATVVSGSSFTAQILNAPWNTVGVLTLVSGTGDSPIGPGGTTVNTTATYTTPSSPAPLYIDVELVAGGGGGASGGNSGGPTNNGTSGTDTTFGSILSANGGTGGNAFYATPGGSASVVTSSTVLQIYALTGGAGNAGSDGVTPYAVGGVGGNSYYGGAGGGNIAAQVGFAAAGNTGSGGGGGSSGGSGTQGGAGGGAGGFAKAQINSPSGTYSITLGVGGAGGAAGGGGATIGGSGAASMVIVREYYQ